MKNKKPKNEGNGPSPARSSPPEPSPPGTMVTSHGHGLQRAEPTVVGVAHLRKALELSGDGPIERLCEDAAVEIERLRTAYASAGRPSRHL